MTETGFSTDWLEERFRFDEAARNTDISRHCLDYISQLKSPVHILDLGAGNGGNLVYALKHWHFAQQWTLLELNPLLLQAARKRIYSAARQHHFKVLETTDSLELSRKEYSISIHFRKGSFLDLATHIDLSTVQLATAGAVIDLLSLPLYIQLSTILLENKIPLLATINYTGMTFLPSTTADAFYIQKYGEHMEREQSFGRSMGAHSQKHILSHYKEQRVNCRTGSSPWQVRSNDQKMLSFLLSYMEEAVPACLLPTEKEAFSLWMKEKRAMVKKGKLEIIVHHFDLFTECPPS